MKHLASVILILGTAGCAQEFDPYNELIGFRVLAVRADRPELAPGLSATLDALIHVNEGASVAYAWSWCPFRGSAESRYDCAVSRDDLQGMIDQAAGGGVVTIPAYELSSTSTATFTYDLPPQLFSELCAALQGRSLPTFVEAPECDGTFEITIRLIASSEGKEIVTVKELQLRYDGDQALNANPAITGVRYWSSEEEETSAEELLPGSPPTLKRDQKYKLRLNVPEDDAEMGTRREILFVTWFTEGGALDSQRTTFIEGEVAFDVLENNELTTPRKADYPGERLGLSFVIRDDRGGASWIQRTVLLGE